MHSPAYRYYEEISFCLRDAANAIAMKDVYHADWVRSEALANLNHALANARYLPSNSRTRALRGWIAQAIEALQ